MKAAHRWALYGVAAVATAIAMQYDSAPDAVVMPSAAAQAPRPAAAQRPQPDDRWALPRRLMTQAGTDPFDGGDAPPQAPPAVAITTPAAAPVPQPLAAPPLPFAYLGHWLERGTTVVFLATPQGTNLAARAGATLEGDYRVEQVGEHGMTLLHLPTRTRQALSFAEPRSAPGPSPAAQTAAPPDAATEETN